MAKVPLPERGQPLDLAYIYSLAQAINDLSGENSALTQGNNFVLQGQVGGNKSSKLLKSQVIGGYTTISSSSPISGNEYTATISFVQPFASPPIVTATLVNVGDTDIDTKLVIKNITTTDVTVSVKFNTTTASTVGVNVIAIGLPANT
jgi:hypothetical protein